MVKAIAIAHQFDIFHRDLKPSNIMVSNDPNLSCVKLTDFGIAKMTEEEFNDRLLNGESSIQASQTVLGAIPFISPELIQTPTTATKSSDIWAVGAILYYLMTGKYPFGNGLQAIVNISKDKLPDKSLFLLNKIQFEGLCDQLWRIISICLQKNPMNRPRADELVNEFSSVCYSVAERRIGTISGFIEKQPKNGFIRTKDGDVFFHDDSVYSQNIPTIGMEVNFAQYDGQPSPRAHPVLLLK